MIGSFVPWNPQKKNSPGWITDANGCDIWQGAKNQGYAKVRHNSRMVSVYRIRYEREVGPIPEGLQLDHFVCSNGPGGCCNPFHCRPVTQRENLLRGNGVSAMCAAKTHCPKGHPLSGDNLSRWHLKANGERVCRTCINARNKDLRDAKRAELAA